MTNEPIIRPLTLNDYQARAADTARYPHAGRGDWMALAYLGLGLGEAGEIQGKVKKILRDAGGEINDAVRIAIGQELGDLQWYVAMLSRELSLPLETIAQMNLNKLADRKARGVLGGSGDDR